MEIRKRIGVSPRVVIRTAIVLDAGGLLFPRRGIVAGDISAEVELFNKAIEESAAQVNQLHGDIPAKHGKDIGGIFAYHLAILRDKTLLTQIIKEIQTQATTAEYAVSVIMRKYAAVFTGMSDKY